MQPLASLGDSVHTRELTAMIIQYQPIVGPNMPEAKHINKYYLSPLQNQSTELQKLEQFKKMTAYSKPSINQL